MLRQHLLKPNPCICWCAVFTHDLSSGGWSCKESLSISLIIAGFNSLFRMGPKNQGEKGARRELLEYMHYVSYPTEKKTALRVGMRAAGGAAR